MSGTRTPQGSSSLIPPRSWWREVPCGHPPDPLAWDNNGERFSCHCGSSLDVRRAIPVPEAPGPVVPCDGCGCHVACVTGHVPGGSDD